MRLKNSEPQDTGAAKGNCWRLHRLLPIKSRSDYNLQERRRYEKDRVCYIGFEMLKHLDSAFLSVK